MKAISIIIPIYNVEEYIYECLCSVANQSFTNLECLLINDNSPDKSISIAKEFIEHYKGSIEFKIISHETNQGLSAARNTGVKYATGTYLYFLDSDDEIYPNALEKLYITAQKYNSNFTVGNFTVIGTNIQEENLKSYDFLPIKDKVLYSNTNIVKAYFKNHFYVMACNKLIKREFLLKNDLWFPQGLLHEDHFWTFKLASCADSMSIYKQPTYKYKLRSNSITGNITERNVSHMVEILHLCCMITKGKSNPYLKGKLRSIANYTIRKMMNSPSIDEKKKIEFITSIKRTIPEAIYLSFPLSIIDGLKQFFLCLPSIFIYKISCWLKHK